MQGRVIRIWVGPDAEQNDRGRARPETEAGVGWRVLPTQAPDATQKTQAQGEAHALCRRGSSTSDAQGMGIGI